MTVQAGLCQTCSDTTLLVFPRGGSYCKQAGRKQRKHSHTATFDKYTGSGVNMCIQKVKETIYDVQSFPSAPSSKQKLQSDGSSNRIRKKCKRAEIYLPAIIKHKIDMRFKNGISEDNINPIDCNKTRVIVRYADDIMYWSKPISIHLFEN